MASTLHVAWGTGNGWPLLTTPEIDPAAVGLTNEIGRRLITDIHFADTAGSLYFDPGSFSPTDVPSGVVYLTADFDFSDSPSSIIREIGIFVGTQINIPNGTGYLTPSQIANPGRLLMVQNITALFRDISKREHFEFAIAF